MGKKKTVWQEEYREAFGQDPEGLTIDEIKVALRGEVIIPEVINITDLFWKNPMHFHSLGTVRGKVTREQIDEWNRITPEGTDITKHLIDYDPDKRRTEEMTRKGRERLGLPD